MTTAGQSERAGASHAVALALAVVALLLRLWHLDRQPLWLDETLTAHIAHLPDGMDFVHNTPPLYHWLTRWWGDAFGIGAAGLRSLSAIGGAVFVWLSFHTARTVGGSRAAFVTALLVLCSPLHLYYSQEARAYSWLLCELMLALWMLSRLVTRPDARTWIVLVLASTAALHTHYLSAIPLAIAHLMFGLSVPRPGRMVVLRRIGSAGATACLLLLPWLLWWRARTPFAPEDMQWLVVLWSQMSGLGAIGASLEMFVLGAQADRAPVFLKQFTSMPFPAWLRLLGLGAAALLLVLGALHWPRRGPARRAALPWLALAFGPLLCLWAVSLVRPVYCPGRYDLVAFPGFVLLLGQAVAVATESPRRPLRWFAGAALTVLTVAIATKDWRYFDAAALPDPAPAVASHLLANVQDGDTVILCGSAALPVLTQFYQHDFVWGEGRCRSLRTPVAFGCRLLPPSLETAPAAVSRYLRSLEAGTLADELGQLLASLSAARVWLVLGPELHGDGMPEPMQRAALALFEVLGEAGYHFVGGESSLGVACLRRTDGR